MPETDEPLPITTCQDLPPTISLFANPSTTYVRNLDSYATFAGELDPIFLIRERDNQDFDVCHRLTGTRNGARHLSGP